MSRVIGLLAVARAVKHHQLEAEKSAAGPGADATDCRLRLLRNNFHLPLRRWLLLSWTARIHPLWGMKLTVARGRMVS